MEEKLQKVDILEVIDIYNNLYEMEDFLEKQEKLIASSENDEDD